MRRVLAALISLFAALTFTLVLATPAQADACGDTRASWVPLTGSEWITEVYLYPNVDFTGEAVMTYAGQLSALVVDDSVQVFTGSWDFDSGQLIWSATDVADNSYRLTFVMDANDCGLLGGVHSANGDIIQQDVGLVGVAYMTRIL